MQEPMRPPGLRLPPLPCALTSQSGTEGRSHRSPPANHSQRWGVSRAADRLCSLLDQKSSSGQEVPPGDAAQVAAEVTRFLSGCPPQGLDRQWWAQLLDVLRLLRPIRGYLSDQRGLLLPALERVHREYERHSEALSDLGIPGALRSAFPEDRSSLFTLPQRLEERYRPRPAPLRLWDLPRYLASAGAELAESIWLCNRGGTTLALQTDLPVQIVCDPVMGAQRQVPTPPSPLPPPQRRSRPRSSESVYVGMSGYEAAEVLVQYRHLGKVVFLHLNRLTGIRDSFYDLVVVPASRRHPQHFLFSPFGVLWVDPLDSSETLDLGAWHREAVVCRALRTIPTFRDFLRRRAFTRWRSNSRRRQFLRTRETLSRSLIQAVPHYMAALQHIRRLLLELAETPWLPHSRAGSLLIGQLEESLSEARREAASRLQHLLTLVAGILEMVREDTYTLLRSAQRDTPLSPTPSSRGQQQQVESWLHRLGNLASLVGHMICQELHSHLQQSTLTFLQDVVQIRGDPLLQLSLEFGETGELRLSPPQHLLQQSLNQSLQAIQDSALQELSRFLQSGRSVSSATAAIFDPGSPPLRVTHSPVPPSGSCRELPKNGELRVEGRLQRCHYMPLPLHCLPRLLQGDPALAQARDTLQRLLEESLAEVERFSEEHQWLREIHQFVHSGAPPLLKQLRGQSAAEYEDLILRVQRWEQRVGGVMHQLSTPLLSVSCASIWTQTGPGLAAILQDLLALLTSEVAGRSSDLIQELSQVLEVFQGVTMDIPTFSRCAHKVTEYTLKKSELQEGFGYVGSLQEVIRVNFRQLTVEEQSVSNQLTDIWDAFQHHLKTSAEFLSSHLSSMSDSLERSFLDGCIEVESIITPGSAPRYLDPDQNSALILTELQELHQNLRTALSRLRDLSQSRHILQAKPFDLSEIVRGEQRLQARLEVWKLLTRSREQISTWKLRPFTKVNTEQMREKLCRWGRSLQELGAVLSEDDPVIRSGRSLIQDFSQHLPLLRSLLSPSMTPQHWTAIFTVMGARFPGLEALTLQDILSCPLTRHQEQIQKVLVRSQAELSLGMELRRIQTFWKEREFSLVRFLLCVPARDPEPDRSKRPPTGRFRKLQSGLSSRDSGTYLLTDASLMGRDIDDSLLSLQTMRGSEFSAGIREDISAWIQKLQDLELTVDLWTSFQQRWVFLMKVQHELQTPLPDAPMMEERFQPISQNYRSFLEVTLQDPQVLSILNPTRRREHHHYGDALCSAFRTGIGLMEDIIGKMADVLYSYRCAFPRLFFLSDQDLLGVLTASPEPSERLPCALRCFPQLTDVVFKPQSPQVSGFPLYSSCALTVGVTGSFREKLDFTSPIPWNPKTIPWLIEVKEKLQESVRSRLELCLSHFRESRWNDMGPCTDQERGRVDPRSQIDQERGSENARPQIYHGGGMEDTRTWIDQERGREDPSQQIDLGSGTYDTRTWIDQERGRGDTRQQINHVGGMEDTRRWINQERGREDARKQIDQDRVREATSQQIDHESGREDTRSWIDLGLAYPWQCIQVTEEVLWCEHMEKLLLTDLKSALRVQHRLKIEMLAQRLRSHAHDFTPATLRRQQALLSAWITLAIQQRDRSQSLLEAGLQTLDCFPWSKMMKYRTVKGSDGPRCEKDNSEMSGSPSLFCYVDMLGYQLPYGWEYVGLDMNISDMMLTDRTTLGLMLALHHNQCGTVIGQDEVSRRQTLMALGSALGRQVEVLKCWAGLTLGQVTTHLQGALCGGTWLVLDGVHKLQSSIRASLGQILMEIQTSCQGAMREEQSNNRQEVKALGSVQIQGRTLSIKHGYHCFITMPDVNASSPIPHSLRPLLRPVSLRTPDIRSSAEAALLAAGFQGHLYLAQKIAHFFHLAQECGAFSAANSSILLRAVIQRATTILKSKLNHRHEEKDLGSISDPNILDPQVTSPTHRHNEKDLVRRSKESDPTLQDLPVSISTFVQNDEDLGRRSNQSDPILVDPQVTSSTHRTNEKDVDRSSIESGTNLIDPQVNNSTHEKDKKISMKSDLNLQYTPTTSSNHSMVRTKLWEEKSVMEALSTLTITPGLSESEASHLQDILWGLSPLYTDINAHSDTILRNVITQVLQESGLEVHSDLHDKATQLFQALHLNSGVVLTGPAGGGKTTCWKVLHRALNHLLENVDSIESSSNGQHGPVQAVSLFPNSLSPEDLFGGGSDEGHKGGIFSSILRMAERESRAEKWVILDGTLAPGWMEPMSCLFGPHPMLTLASGEKICLSSRIKLLFETSDASALSPAVTTQCGIVHIAGQETWKAVLRAVTSNLHVKYRITWSTQQALQSLSHSLIHRTLCFLEQRCTPALYPHTPQAPGHTAPGIQEVSSLCSIFQTLMDQHLLRDCGRATSEATENSQGSAGHTKATPTTDLSGSPYSSQQETTKSNYQQALTYFLYAFIWGFGGHLHPRHRLEFEEFFRASLSHYSIPDEIPQEVSLFDVVPAADGSALVPCVRAGFPQSESLLYVVRCLAVSGRPVLVVGSPGSGKTTLVQSAIPHGSSSTRIPFYSALKTSTLRRLITSRPEASLTTVGLRRAHPLHSRHVIFLDDLHEAAADPKSQSHPLLETVRHLVSDPSSSSSFMATASPPEDGFGLLSPRLSRLFSVLVLAPFGPDILKSIFTTRFTSWMKKSVPPQQHLKDFGEALALASIHLYQQTAQTLPPKYRFSLHSLHRVLRSMTALCPAPGPHLSTLSGAPLFPAAVLTRYGVVLLWMHEALRTFSDGLESQTDREAFRDLLRDCVVGMFYSRAEEANIAQISREEDPPSTARSPDITEHQSASPIPEYKEEDPPSTSTSQESKKEGPPSTSPIQESKKEGPPSTSTRRESKKEDPPSTSPIQESKKAGPPSTSPIQESKEEDHPSTSINRESKKEDPPSTSTIWESKEEDHPSTSPIRESKKDDHPSTSRTRESKKEGPPSTSRSRESKKEGPPSTSAIWESKEGGPSSKACSPDITVHQPESPVRESKEEGPPSTARSLDIAIHPLLPAEMMQSDQDIEELSFCLDSAPGRMDRSDVPSYKQRPPGTPVITLDPPDLILSPTDQLHLTRLLRVLLVPRGHMVLLSQYPGTGRRSLARLAARTMQCTLLELSGTETSEECRGVVREACRLAGALGTPTAILVSNSTPEEAMRDLEVLIREGTIPGLYTPEEEEALLQTMLREERSRGRVSGRRALRERFIAQARDNLHLMFLQRGVTPPASLSRYCYTDIYEPWDMASLYHVAERLLKDFPGPWPSRAPLPRVMSLIHVSARSRCQRRCPGLPLASPRTFITFIKIFLRVFSHRRSATRRSIERLQGALCRVEEVSAEREKWAQEEERLSQSLQRAAEESERWRVELEETRMAEQQVRMECDRLLRDKERLQGQLSSMQEKRRHQLEEACSQWSEVQKLLKVSDVEEIRSYRAPPAAVMMVTDVLCAAFQREAGWESAKLLLGHEDFYQELQFYDAHRMPDSVFSALSLAVSRDEFSASSVRPASSAAASLCDWLCGLQRFCRVLRGLRSGRGLLLEAESQDLEAAERIAERRLHQDRLRTRRDQIRLRLQNSRNREEELQEERRRCQERREAAQECEGRVQPHREGWSSALETLQKHLQVAATESLLVSASVCFLGCLPWPRGVALLKTWRRLCDGQEVPLDPDDVRDVCHPPPPAESSERPLLEMLSDTSHMMEGSGSRHLGDTEALTRAALLRYAARYSPTPLLVCDPDNVAKPWLLGAEERGLSEDPNNGRPRLDMMDASSPELPSALTSAAREDGAPLLIINVEKNLSCLETLSSAADPPLAITPIILHTCLPLREFVEVCGPAFMKSVSLIDLSLGPEAFQEELLDKILLAKDPRLLEERRRLHCSQLQLEAGLHQAQEALLNVMATGPTLLQRSNLLQGVSASEEEQQRFRVALADVVALQRPLVDAVARYLPAAQRGCLLYSRLQEVSRLSAQYSFPARSLLHWARRTLQGHVEAGTALEEALVGGILSHVLPSLTPEHRHLLRLLMAIGFPPRMEWLCFLGVALGAETTSSSTCIQKPAWLDGSAWEELGHLEKMVQSFRGIRSSLSAQTQQWWEYFTLRSTVIGLLPGSAFSHLTLFQTAILWRIVKPDCLDRVLAHLVSCAVGPETPDPAEGEEILALSDPNSPVIFLLTGGTPWTYRPEDFIRGQAQRLGKEVKVLAWRESLPESEVRSTVLSSQAEGDWVLLYWHPRLAHLLEDMAAADPAQVHPEFRMGVVVQEAELSAVSALLQRSPNSAPIMLRPQPRLLLSQSCMDIAEEAGTGDAQLLRLLPFHVTLLLRQEYSEYSQSHAHAWGHEELRLALHSVERLNSDWPEAVEYLAGEVIYGGHVTEEAEAAVVMAVAQQSLQDQPMSRLISSVHGGRGSGTRRLLQTFLSRRGMGALALSEGLPAAIKENVRGGVLASLLATQDLWTSSQVVRCEKLLRRRSSSGSCGGTEPTHEEPLSCWRSLLMELDVTWAEQHRMLDGCGQEECPGEWSQSATWRRGQEECLGERSQSASWKTGQHESQLTAWRRSHPLKSFLWEEWRILGGVIHQAAQEVEEAESLCCCPRCRQIRESLSEGHLPPWWDVYSSSPSPPNAWISALRARIHRLSGYLQAPTPAGGTYHLSVFRHPARLLQSLLMEQAQRDRRELDAYSLHVQVTDRRRPVTEDSAPAVQISLGGIELKHALWDTRLSTLQETLSHKPCPLPELRLSAVCRRGNRTPPPPEPATPPYLCPLYPQEIPGDNTYPRQPPLLLIPLPTNLPPRVWCLRRVHALSGR